MSDFILVELVEDSVAIAALCNVFLLQKEIQVAAGHVLAGVGFFDQPAEMQLLETLCLEIILPQEYL